MSDFDKSMLNLPTATDVRRWQKELAALQAREAEMKERHAAEERAIREERTKLNKLVSAAAAFLGIDPEGEPDFGPVDAEKSKTPAPEAAKPAAQRRREKGSWTQTIFGIIKGTGGSIAYADIKEAVAETHLGDTLEKTEKSFYGALRRLEKHKKIVRHNGRAFLPKAYQQFLEDVQAGRISDDTPAYGSGKPSPNHVAIREYLTKNQNGVAPGKMLDDLINNPPEHLKVSKNRGSLHNAIKKLRDNGDIIKREGRYYLSHPKNEAPDPGESSASDNIGEGGTSPNESLDANDILG